MSALTDQLEPIAAEAAVGTPTLGAGDVALLSLAVSAKRIADALDGTTLGVDITESLAGLGHAFIIGRRNG